MKTTEQQRKAMNSNEKHRKTIKKHCKTETKHRKSMNDNETQRKTIKNKQNAN